MKQRSANKNINKALLQADGALSRDIMPALLHPNAKGYQIWSDAIADKVGELQAE